MSSRRREAEDEDHQAEDKARHEAEQHALKGFRSRRPARFANQRLYRWNIGRPNEKGQQANWSIYTAKQQNSVTKILQQHLIIPLFVPHSQNGPTQPLAGDALTAPTQRGGKEHVTNIYRMEASLKEHPEVDCVNRWKEHKGEDDSRFDKDGRCVHGHQSPFDIRVNLAATGAKMELGCTANKINKESLAL